MRAPIVLYGNCQAQFLRELFSAVPSLAERFTFVVVSDVIEPGSSLSPVPAEAERAAAVLQQLDQREQLPRRDELLGMIPAGCPIVRFPPIVMNAFWPFRARDLARRPEPGRPWGPFPIGDGIALEIARLPEFPARPVERYLELSEQRMPDVAHLVAFYRAAFARRDAACDVVMGDFVFDRLLDAYQFWTHVHVAIGVFEELGTRLTRALGEVVPGIADGVSAELAGVCAGYGGQGEFQLPIHPGVIERLGLTFANAETRYRWFDQSWTFAEYVEHYLAYLKARPPSPARTG